MLSPQTTATRASSEYKNKAFNATYQECPGRTELGLNYSA
jgi:hypothetical protein